MPPLISVVIPAYNEEARLRDSVVSVMAAAKQAGDVPIEIVVVDDGSRDKTPEVVRGLEAEFPNVRSVTHAVNQGFGATVKDGIRAAKGDKLCLFPGDNATSVYSMKNVFLHSRDADMVIGYFMDTEKRSRFRNAFSTVFNQVYCLTFNVHVRYLQGSPCYPLDRLRQITIRTDGLSILAEINVKLLRGGASFIEVDGYYNPEMSKSSMVGLRALLRAVTHAAWNYLQLVYEVYVSTPDLYNHRPTRVTPPGVAR